jgi:hypothetical protein
MLLDLSCSLGLPPVRADANIITDCEGRAAPTLLPEAEYIVPSGLVLESLKMALARTAMLHTMRESQLCIGGKSRSEGRQQGRLVRLKGRCELRGQGEKE